MGKMRAAREVELLVLPLSLHYLPLYWLVVWNMFYDFPYIGNFIFPTDFHIFQRGRAKNHQPVLDFLGVLGANP
jgi:hypothetical protein